MTHYETPSKEKNPVGILHNHHQKEKVKILWILWIGHKNNNISTANRPGITLGTKKEGKEKLG